MHHPVFGNRLFANRLYVVFNIPRRRPFNTSIQDNRTIAEIYSDLPSPRIPSDDLVSGVARHILSGEDIEGLRSTLYTYQRRSVAAMIQKEMCHDHIPDPLFVSIAGVDGREFYMQPSTMEILQERPMVQPIQGGVLCEELGESDAGDVFI